MAGSGKRMVLVAVMAVLGTGLARAQPAAIVLQYGETTGDRSARPIAEDPGTGLTPARTIYNLEFVNHSDQIEAALCRGFGVTIIVVLQPGQSFPDRLVARTHSPMLRRPDGATSEESSFSVSGSDGMFYAGFTFDYTWEMQPGPWEIAFYDGETRLAGKTFTVRRPDPGHPLSICDGAPTS